MLISVRAVSRSTVAVGLNRATGNDLHTARSLPGTALRGALGARYIGLAGSTPRTFRPDDKFKLLFLGGIRFRSLLPKGANVWPLSARTCRLEGPSHGLHDLLISAAAGIPTRVDCPQCAAKLDLPDNFCSPGPNYEERCGKDTRRVAHVEIDLDSKRSRTGAFYSARVIERDDWFAGYWEASPEAAAALNELIGPGITLYLGRGKTRGQGKIQLGVPNPAPPADPLDIRIRKFNEAIHCRYPSLVDRFWISCTFRSPAILLSRWLLYRTWLDPAEDLGTPFAGFKLANWFARPLRVGGWHAAAGLPKAEADAIAAGSSFLLCGPLAGLTPESVRLLETLEAQGIGERTIEGFGHAVFCDPFHTQFSEGGERVA